jgi:hypothetical protein
MRQGLSRRRLVGLVTGAAVAVTAAVLEATSTGSAVATIRTFIAAAIAVAAVGLALSLPGSTARGVVIGSVFVAAGIFTWTFTAHPGVIWGLLAAGGVIFAVWTWPWLPHLRPLPRLGSVWLGLAYWLFGTVGAVLVGHLGVAAQRTAYAGLFTLAALAVTVTIRRDRGRRDLTVGIAAAMLVGIAALLLAGSASLLTEQHAIPDNVSAAAMHYRFWGGPGLFYHPNSMAGLAIAAAVRIGPDRAFAAWQRLSVTLLAGFVLYLSDSKIGIVFFTFAALVHAVLVLRRTHADLPAHRRPWLVASAPFAVLALVLLVGGLNGFFFHARFKASAGTTSAAAATVTSGRTDTWRQVATDWWHAGWAEKAFGNAQTSRAVVIRANDGSAPDAPRRKLNTDNAAVGAFRRGGVLGAAAFLFGLLLLIRNVGLRWRGLRWRAGPGRWWITAGVPAWFLVAAIGLLPTIATEDWILGGTNGVLWILLLAGEAGVLLARAAGTRASGTADAALVPAAAPAPAH